MASAKYFAAAIDALERIAETQTVAIERAALLLVDAVIGDKKIFSFGASHSFILTEELVYRTGGLMLINPIYPHGMNLLVRPMTQTSQLERVLGLGTEFVKSSPLASGDVLLIASTSGRNAVAIDVALAAVEMGVATICITSKAYSDGVASRHPSRKKVMDICDVVIDNCAPYGDACVEIPGFSQKVGPLSTVTGCAIVNAIVSSVVEQLVERGIVPPVFISANLDGGDEHNAKLLAQNKHRIFYLD